MLLGARTGESARLIHPALEPAPGGEAAILRSGAGTPGLTDRRRVGLLLQGAALLAHLDSAAAGAVRSWRGAAVTPAGRLCGVELAPASRRFLCQESLRELVAVLFGASETLAADLPGRGVARRAVRRLLVRWRSSLTPLPPHRAVTEVLEVAPFLWEADHAGDREALAAELRRRGSRVVLLAGAGAGGWARRLSGNGTDELTGLRDALASPNARRLWGGAAADDPAALAAAGRWRAAVAAWAVRGADGEAERLAHGMALLSDGRFAAAAEVFGGLARAARGAEARGRALAGEMRARLLLGELGAVRRRLARPRPRNGPLARLPAAVLVELADVAQRAFSNSRNPERGAAWVERALDAAREEDGDVRALAEIVAATSAWDRGDLDAIDRHLEASRGAVSRSPEVAWRWHHAAGLRALAAGDGEAMAAAVRRALACARRSLRREQAGGLWSDLGVARARLGDLAGAERAFLHAQRLFASCEGPRRTTLALHNLAEIRLRRGRVRGVEEILSMALEENRLAGNVRGQIHDLSLLARYELVLGRPEAALAYCAEAEELDESGRGRCGGWNRAEIRLLEARSHGWLDRPADAARALTEVPPSTLPDLEPEERPALFALAGLREEAREIAAGLDAAPGGGPAGLIALWLAVLDGDPVPTRLWDPLAVLEPFRSARAVLDLELVRPRVAPAAWRRRAVAVFRRLGADASARRLELVAAGAWGALEHYLAVPRRGLPELRALFAEAGAPEACIELHRDGARGAPEILVGGEGGGEELSAPLEGRGRLTLRVGRIDATVRALFALAIREIVGGAGLETAAAAPRAETGPRAARRAGIVGDSPALTAAIDRATRMAAGDLPILVTGESGTGKELVARLVHRESRRSGELVAINCAALSENLLLSDLFGHVRGAFTGADRDRAGVFETARGGTVFLDEIGDLPPPAQGTLLRVLQEGEVRRLGESLPRKVDARLVAATHRDLGAMVEEGVFRRDLFFRLSVARVELPPLRERGDDVLRIADRVLEELAPGARLAGEARRALAAHPWPGNVRELRNVLEVAVALARGESDPFEIAREHLELDPGHDRAEAGLSESAGADYHGRVEAFRRRLVREALEASGGNRAEAARRLGLTRQALSYLVKQMRIV